MRMRARDGIWNAATFVVLAATVFLSGCDTLAEDDRPQFERTVSFRFEFTAEGGSVGDDVEATSTQVVDLDDVLEGFGYTKGDVISVRVLDAELNLVQPAQLDLTAFSEASLALSASGGSEQAVAQSSALQGDRASLSVTGSAVTGIVTAPTFSAVLRVVPTLAEQFVVTASVDLGIEVEGI